MQSVQGHLLLRAPVLICLSASRNHILASLFAIRLAFVVGSLSCSFLSSISNIGFSCTLQHFHHYIAAAHGNGWSLPHVHPAYLFPCFLSMPHKTLESPRQPCTCSSSRWHLLLCPPSMMPTSHPSVRQIILTFFARTMPFFWPHNRHALPLAQQTQQSLKTLYAWLYPFLLYRFVHTFVPYTLCISSFTCENLPLPGVSAASLPLSSTARFTPSSPETFSPFAPSPQVSHAQLPLSPPPQLI